MGLIPGYRGFGGQHCDSAALKHVLDFHGVLDPYTEQPFSEAMVLGLGGGVGAGYFTFGFGNRPFLVLGTRYQWQSYKAEFADGVCQRLGLPFEILETGSVSTAEWKLNEAIAQDKLVIAIADRGGLKYHALPEHLSGAFSHTVVVYGVDESSGDVHLSDMPHVPLRVRAEEFRAARRRITTTKQRALIVQPPPGDLDLEAAVRSGIQACVEYNLHPPIKNFGLAALEKWADLVANSRDKKGWPSLFKPDRHFFEALRYNFIYVETFGTGGGAFRPMYAEFLDEAGDVLHRPSLWAVADQYRLTAALWGEVARRTLPDEVPLLAETRQIELQRHALFLAQGEGARSALDRLNLRLDQIRSEVEEQFPLSDADRQALQEDLRALLLRLHTEELAATEALAAAIA